MSRSAGARPGVEVRAGLAFASAGLLIGPAAALNPHVLGWAAAGAGALTTLGSAALSVWLFRRRTDA